MTSFGDDWDRFASRHLGDWHGRSLAISVSNGSVVSAVSYHLSCEAVSRSQTNNSSLVLTCAIKQDPSSSQVEPSQSHEMLLRYNLDRFHCFADGSYSADHNLLEAAVLLPDACKVVHYAAEFALPVSATERVRCFMLYDEERILSKILLLEEVRSALFDTREPLALTSLVGEWRGQSETFRHGSSGEQRVGFGTQSTSESPSRRVRRAYSEDDLPPQLKNPSGGNDGLLKTKTSVRFGWDPAKGTVRRSTVLTDMQDHELGRSVIYGALGSDSSGLFDVVHFESNTENESVLVPLNNASFVMAPLKRVRGVTAAGELGCHITPGFRRRLVRIYGKSSVVSETVASESLR